MEDFVTTSENNQEVAEPEEVVTEEETQETEQAETVEVAKPQQDSATNAKFAQMRREKENAERENRLLLESLRQYGYQGTSQEVADLLIAQKTGQDINQVRAEREAKERSFVERSQTQIQNQMLIEKVADYMKQDDLRKIQSIDPKVKSLDELGGEFAQLVGAGLSAELAYHVLKSKEQANTKPTPKDPGPIKSISNSKDFITKDEFDKLTDSQLDDPKIMKLVRKSMLKW